MARLLCGRPAVARVAQRRVATSLAWVTAALLAFASACLPDYRFTSSATDADVGDATAAGDAIVPGDATAPGDAIAPSDATPPGDANQPRDASNPPETAPTEAGAEADAPVAYSLTAGADDNCVVRQGRVYCWGLHNDYGQLGAAPDASPLPRPRPIDQQTSSFGRPDEVRMATTTDRHSNFACARAAGAVYCWGFGEVDQRGADFGSNDGPQITLVPFLGADATQVALGGAHACGLRATADAGNVYCWGWTGDDATGLRDGLGAGHHVTGVPALAFVAGGGEFTCGITQADGHVVCWGRSLEWRAGQEPTDQASADAGCTNGIDCLARTITLPGGVVPVSLALGECHGCALSSAGAVYCWGANDRGQLGASVDPSSACPGLSPLQTGYCNGMQTGACTWTPVRALPGHAMAVTAGFTHTCAVMDDGSAMCWGSNDSGQVGTGDMSDVYLPRVVLDPTTGAAPLSVSAIAAGGTHTCALSGGDLYCWGFPTFEGDGGAGQSLTPQKVVW
jgi:alpha-tubulin suppressor-like RCC1 family protein